MKNSFRTALLCGALLAAGCTTVNESGFTYRDRVDTAESTLNLAGYYAPETLGALGKIVLWEDGTAVASALVGPEYKSGRLAGERMNGERYRNHPKWGAFRLRGDSISIQVFSEVQYGGAPTFNVIEYNGIVLNDTTFVLEESLVRIGADEEESISPVEYRYHFRPLEEKPSSANWTDDL